VKRISQSIALATVSLLVCAAARADEPAAGKHWFGLGGHKQASAETTNAAGPSKASRAIATFTSAPKRLMSSTKNLFVAKKSSTLAERSGTGSRRSKKAKPPEPGFLQSLFAPSEPSPPKTVGDWMRLDPVRP